MRRIRSRMLVASLVLCLLPAVPASLLVRSLLQRSLNPTLQDVITQGLEAGVASSREELRRRRSAFEATVAHLDLGKAKEGLLVLDEGGNVLTAAAMPAGLLHGAHLDAQTRQVGGYLATRRQRADGEAVVITQALPAELVERVDRLGEALGLVTAFRLDRRAILRSYVLPFLLVYAVLAFCALALAALVARSVVQPLETMAQATRRIAGGDLNVRVPERAPGEIGDLARAFNAMVVRLDGQRRELARLEKIAAWRVMARTLAHEVKNPLTPILLAVQEARRSYRGDDAQHAAVLAECENIVSEEVTGLRDLVRSFSDFAKMPAPQLEACDVRSLADDLARLYGERLRLVVTDSPLVAALDAGQIRRALVNLVDNGLAACRRAGRRQQVVLEIRADGDRVVLAVTDCGDGVAPELRQRIFEPDFTTDREGLGLGLPIVDGIVAGHGGRIEVASQPGQGTTFTLALPRGNCGEETSCP